MVEEGRARVSERKRMWEREFELLVHVRVCVYLCVRAGTPHEHVGSGVRRVWEIVWGEKV